MISDKVQRGVLRNSAIILVRPRYPENVGAAARTAYNFGVPRVIVVCDKRPDQERMLKMATHKAAHLIEEMETFQDTGAAVAPFHFLVGTTARQGKHRLREQSPRQVLGEVAPLLSSNKIGLLFGPENTGLTNYDLDFCQYTSTVPTEGFSSLNLAQAVAIHCYELYTAATEITKNHLDSDGDDNDAGGEYANSFEMQSMYGHIEEVLTEITFLKDRKHALWMRNIRQFLGRIQIKKKEASIIRGVCRKFLWHRKVEAEK